LLYGREKIGKTSFAAQFPETLTLLFEPGGKALRIFERKPKSWLEFKGYLELLKADKSFRTVVIDTVDIAFRMCYAYICKREGIDHPSEEKFSKAWTMMEDEFSECMSALLKLDKGVIFISHDKEKEIKTRTGSVHRIVPTMSNQARKVLEPMVDIWVYCRYNENSDREFVLRGDESISAGHRLQNNHFKELITVPMGRTAEEAYKNFVDAFNGKSPETKKPTLKLRK
jgi:hypothetical protein